VGVRGTCGYHTTTIPVPYTSYIHRVWWYGTSTVHYSLLLLLLLLFLLSHFLRTFLPSTHLLHHPVPPTILGNTVIVLFEFSKIVFQKIQCRLTAIVLLIVLGCVVTPSISKSNYISARRDPISVSSRSFRSHLVHLNLVHLVLISLI
jgi:hypothetical protein